VERGGKEENYPHTHIKFAINQFIERALKILSDIDEDFYDFVSFFSRELKNLFII
jgi:hypothetical protein